jgi:all-trans-retinol 13,14-reductase
MNKSAVIIGGGLGGLFTGAILSKEGIKVTVIEKNAIIGGGLQSFNRFGEIFDTGMHVIGGMQKGGNIRRICKYLGVLDKIHTKEVDPMIDSLYFAEDKKVYSISQGKEAFVDSLTKDFPDQKDNLLQYVKAVYEIVDELDLFYLRPSNDYIEVHSDEFMMAANDFISKYISSPKLAAVLAYMNPLYAGRKDITPAYIHALMTVLFINGPSRFAGGSYLFANTLSDCISQNGGQVIANDAVEHIYTKDKFITSVETRKGNVFSADYYISDIHPCTLISLFDDPSAFPKAYTNRLNSIPNSYSAFSLNIKLKPNTVKYFNYSGYYMGNYDDIWNFGKENYKWPLGFLYMTPPEIEQGEYANKMIIMSPMTWDKVSKWENTSVGHRGSEYERWKKECSERIIDCMEEIYPGFSNCIEAINTASPLTIRDFYAVKEGAMYGYSKDCNNMMMSQLPIATKVKNLLLTGQNTNGHGFCGVPLMAIKTSEAILGKNFILNKLNALSEDE